MIAADEICATDAERACLAALRTLTGERDGPMERHGLRVFFVADALAARRGSRVDRELLLCAGLLHDAGLLPGAATTDVYVRDARRYAEGVLAPFAWPAERLTLLGEAIERHHELRAQWRRGAEVELLRRADLLEVSGGLVRFGLSGGWVRGLFAQVPRRGMYPEIGRLLVRALRERPGTLPKIFAPEG